MHARGLARCLNSRAARCVYETAVRNGKARGHGLPLFQRDHLTVYDNFKNYSQQPP